MRLDILDRGHRLHTKAIMALIRVFSGHPVVDAVKLAFYRPNFYGGGQLTHEAMRGRSDWSVGDRELMAAYVSKINKCPFCVSAHSATSTMWYADEVGVKHVYDRVREFGWEPAPLLKKIAEANGKFADATTTSKELAHA